MFYYTGNQFYSNYFRNIPNNKFFIMVIYVFFYQPIKSVTKQ